MNPRSISNSDMSSFLSFSNVPSSSTNVLGTRQPQPPPVVDIPALQSASRVLQDQLVKDAQIIPDLGEMFTSCASKPLLCQLFTNFRSLQLVSQPRTASFPMTIASPIKNDVWLEYQKAYSNTIQVRLSASLELLELTGTLATNVTSHMGLIPELERVWITIDHKLFLWDYVEGSVTILSLSIRC